MFTTLSIAGNQAQLRNDF